MIKAVIFDFGGVIKANDNLSLRNIASAYKISQQDLIKEIKPHIKLFQENLLTENQFWNKLSLSLGRPIPKNKNKLWINGYETNFYIYPEIIDLVKKLKNNRIKTAVLSNTIKPHVNIIDKFGGYNHFDVVILSTRVKLSKPNPEIYLLSAKRLAVKPEECIFIDDRKENLVPAKKLGMRIVLAESPKQIIKDIYQILNFC